MDKTTKRGLALGIDFNLLVILNTFS